MDKAAAYEAWKATKRTVSYPYSENEYTKTGHRGPMTPPPYTAQEHRVSSSSSASMRYATGYNDEYASASDPNRQKLLEKPRTYSDAQSSAYYSDKSSYPSSNYGYVSGGTQYSASDAARYEEYYRSKYESETAAAASYGSSKTNSGWYGSNYSDHNASALAAKYSSYYADSSNYYDTSGQYAAAASKYPCYVPPEEPKYTEQPKYADVVYNNAKRMIAVANGESYNSGAGVAYHNANNGGWSNLDSQYGQPTYDNYKSGMGLALLKKMGWKPGEGLGREKTGNIEPLMLSFKRDKRGLVSKEERRTQMNKKLDQNKHPVTLLCEVAVKRKWAPPVYNSLLAEGPVHLTNYAFSVTVNGETFKPINIIPCQSKKDARMLAAQYCLEQLGLVKKHKNITSLIKKPEPKPAAKTPKAPKPAKEAADAAPKDNSKEVKA